ncbi:lipocalin family protein [Formosa sp. S-31]|uniref:lipocalin family protein n=1 Tax=Formosa sp. S-31 TaxID=2790949 RepID=UPI003EB8B3F4
MKYLLTGLSLILLLACTSKPDINPEDLNGYWEIEDVTLPDGSKHIYKINETVEQFELNDSLKGFRQKMKPTDKDVYIPVTEKETITLKTEGDSINLYYKTPFSSWKETILELDKNHLKLTNPNHNIYSYKRYIPLNL